MTHTRTPLLVLGLGNLICTDDGLGVRAVEALRRDVQPPDGVRLVDGGTQGLALLPTLIDSERVIMVDALATEDAPGTLVRIAGDAVLRELTSRLSVHQVGVDDLLGALAFAGGGPHTIVVLGIVPGSIGLSCELTPRVRAAMPDLGRAIIEEATALGFGPWRMIEDYETRWIDPALSEAR